MIDSTYEGELKVLLYNHSDIDYQVTKGDRIAQILFYSQHIPSITVYEAPSSLQDHRPKKKKKMMNSLDSEEMKEEHEEPRRAAGFGSSGK